jgi:hypothetical protein
MRRARGVLHPAKRLVQLKLSPERPERERYACERRPPNGALVTAKHKSSETEGNRYGAHRPNQTRHDLETAEFFAYGTDCLERPFAMANGVDGPEMPFEQPLRENGGRTEGGRGSREGPCRGASKVIPIH